MQILQFSDQIFCSLDIKSIKLFGHNNFQSNQKVTTATMVKLFFQLNLNMSLVNCWKFFGDFANLDKWDPNVKHSQLWKAIQGPNKEGEVFRLTTVFNGKQSQIDYVMKQYKQHKKIYLRGQNDMITADDEIQFINNGQHSTIVKYTAQIKLKGFYWLFTPLIISDLKKLQQQAMNGMKNKAQELKV